MKKIIIAAVAKNGVIGRTNGEMPWHSKEEFQHFRNTTIGFPLIMGRKTFESLGKPLKGRLNIIITKNPDLKYNFDEVKIFHSLDEAYSYCEKEKFEKIFITGGGHIYNLTINHVDELIISIMNFNAEGDVYFPKIDEKIWKVKSNEKRSEFEIFYYEKI